jgi:hypothetical protein
MEGTGLLLGKERCLVLRADIKQVISSRCGRHPRNFSGKPVSILEMYGIMSNVTDPGSEKSIFIPK